MEIKKEMVLRKIADENILVPGADTVLDLNGLFVLTETGAFIWGLLPSIKTDDEIVEKMLEEYEVDRETAEKDVAEFLDRIRNFGIID